MTEIFISLSQGEREQNCGDVELATILIAANQRIYWARALFFLNFLLAPTRPHHLHHLYHKETP
jgi:hypothetical protein